MYSRNLLVEMGYNHILVFKESNGEEMNEKKLDMNEISETNNLLSILKKRYNIRLKHKNLYIIIEGEEVCIKHLTIPKVKDYEVDKVIYNEMRYYMKDLNDILYAYSIYKENEKNMEVLIFCLNSSKLEILKSLVQQGCRLKVVNTVQICFINYFKNYIIQDIYILIFEFRQNVYFTACDNGKMIGNCLIEISEVENNFISYFKLFVDSIIENKKRECCKNIYFANFPYKSIIKSMTEKYNCVDIGSVPYEKILKTVIMPRRL